MPSADVTTTERTRFRRIRWLCYILDALSYASCLITAIGIGVGGVVMQVAAKNLDTDPADPSFLEKFLYEKIYTVALSYAACSSAITLGLQATKKIIGYFNPGALLDALPTRGSQRINTVFNIFEMVALTSTALLLGSGRIAAMSAMLETTTAELKLVATNFSLMAIRAVAWIAFPAGVLLACKKRFADYFPAGGLEALAPRELLPTVSVSRLNLQEESVDIVTLPAARRISLCEKLFGPATRVDPQPQQGYGTIV
jgi:hypothetical protein